MDFSITEIVEIDDKLMYAYELKGRSYTNLKFATIRSIQTMLNLSVSLATALFEQSESEYIQKKKMI